MYRSHLHTFTYVWLKYVSKEQYSLQLIYAHYIDNVDLIRTHCMFTIQIQERVPETVNSNS